jgi:hypothetical protein
MSGIHRRRPAPIEDADLQTGEAIFTTAGDPPAGPRRFRLDVSPKVVSLSVSEAGGSARRIMRNELNSPASATRSTMPKRSEFSLPGIARPASQTASQSVQHPAR